MFRDTKADETYKVFKYKYIAFQVRHSQRMNDPPLRPWVIAEENGTIQSAHCTCMAGLGEACSHVGALLFYVDAAVKIKNSKTVTEEPAYWKLPSGLQKVQYKPVKDLNFQSAKAMKKSLDSNITAGSTPRRIGGMVLPDVPPPTEGEIATFLRKLHSSKTASAILAVKEEFSSSYVPKCTEPAFPPLMSELYDEACETLSKNDCLSKCEEIFASMSVTKEQCELTEIETRNQSTNKTWHYLRTGRITASRMKSVRVTSLENPSKSLVNSICYPTTTKFSTNATRWGCEHEETARDRYRKEQESSHHNFKCAKSGLVLNPKYPHLGASPDAVVSCDCCGEGCVEIKCPFCIRDKQITDAVDSVAFLEMENGQPTLKKTHGYYYQVQTQLFLCEREFCDFVTWTQGDMIVERIEPDEDFWEDIVSKATIFFKTVILPELVGKLVTKPRDQHLRELKKAPVDVNNNDSQEEVICLCQKVYDETEDDVIGCDGENCNYHWFHFKCVKLKRAPKGTWFCPKCRDQGRPKEKRPRQ